MSKSLMVLGTASNVGKSTITAFLCRYFYNKGLKVAPFKSQNISDIAYKTKDNHYISRAQALQAMACNIEPDYRMNPVLVKPVYNKETKTFDREIVLNGVEYKRPEGQTQSELTRVLLTEIEKAYKELANEYDIVIIEGAGSCAEINLVENDVTNLAIANITNSPCILVSDIDRGGVFASLYGSYMLQTEQNKKYIKATVINKFQGDLKEFENATKMLEDIMHIPCLGVLPSTKIDIEPEDILAQNEVAENTVFTNDFDQVVKNLEKHIDLSLIEKIINEGV